MRGRAACGLSLWHMHYAQRTCPQARVNPMKATITAAFKEAVGNLKGPTDSAASEAAVAMLSMFGTHYVSRVVFGTRGSVMSKFDKDKVGMQRAHILAGCSKADHIQCTLLQACSHSARLPPKL